MSKQLLKDKEKFMLEGALGYARRICDKIEDKTTVEEINQMVQNDVGAISGALSSHCKQGLMFAGMECGLFEDHLPQSDKS
ncbi:MAG: hypothetical protein ABSA79_01045 [Candidatus Bathyarchaeia archaeon]|jgi:hypothetical protein